MDKGRGQGAPFNSFDFAIQVVDIVKQTAKAGLNLIRSRARKNRKGVQHCWDSHELKAITLQALRQLELARHHSDKNKLQQILHPRLLLRESSTADDLQQAAGRNDSASNFVALADAPAAVVQLQAFLIKTMIIHPIHDLMGQPGEIFVTQLRRHSSKTEEYWAFMRILKGKWQVLEIGDDKDIIVFFERMSSAEIQNLLDESAAGTHAMSHKSKSA